MASANVRMHEERADAAVHGIMTMTRGKGRYALTPASTLTFMLEFGRCLGRSVRGADYDQKHSCDHYPRSHHFWRFGAHHRHHHQAMNASPVVGAPPPIGAPSPVIWPGAVSSSDHADYVKNLPRIRVQSESNFNSNGHKDAIASGLVVHLRAEQLIHLDQLLARERGPWAAPQHNVRVGHADRLASIEAPTFLCGPCLVIAPRLEISLGPVGE